MSYAWAKIWIEALDDRKVASLPDSSWRRFFECVLLAKELDEGGFLPAESDMAWRLRLEPTALRDDMSRLAMAGLVELRPYDEDGDRWYMPKFEKRQGALSSTERTQMQRAREQKATYGKTETWRTKIWRELPASPGIYLLGFRGSEDVYVGASINIQQRIRQHMSEMQGDGWRFNDQLKEFGQDALYVEVLEHTDDSALLPKLESKWIKKYSDRLLNSDATGKRHRAWDDSGTIRPTDNRQDKTTDKTRQDNNNRQDAPAGAVVVVELADVFQRNGLANNSRTAALAAQDWVTPDYVDAVCDYVRRSGAGMGLAVELMAGGFEPPAAGRDLARQVPAGFEDVIQR